MDKPNDTAPEPMGDDESAKITGGISDADLAGTDCGDCGHPPSDCECDIVVSVGD